MSALYGTWYHNIAIRQQIDKHQSYVECNNFMLCACRSCYLSMGGIVCLEVYRSRLFSKLTVSCAVLCLLTNIVVIYDFQCATPFYVVGTAVFFNS